jgi:hypothetical protein
LILPNHKTHLLFAMRPLARTAVVSLLASAGTHQTLMTRKKPLQRAKLSPRPSSPYPLSQALSVLLTPNHRTIPIECP